MLTDVCFGDDVVLHYKVDTIQAVIAQAHETLSIELNNSSFDSLDVEPRLTSVDVSTNSCHCAIFGY